MRARDYVPFVTASHRIWRELEAETGETLLNACGALVMAPGQRGLLASRQAGLRRTLDQRRARAPASSHEVLDGAAVARRFPQFLNLAGDEKAYYEPGGGYVFPERCIAAQLAPGGRPRAPRSAPAATVRRAAAGRRAASVSRPRTATILADRAVVAAGRLDRPAARRARSTGC